jgi:predicted nucleotidyltransferase
VIDLTEDQMDYIVSTVVEPLDHLGAKVYCFGSRARGEAAPFSDLDLMVVSGESLDSMLSEIRETLAEGNFPFLVDIVEERNFAGAYRENYLAERVLIQSDSNQRVHIKS